MNGLMSLQIHGERHLEAKGLIRNTVYGSGQLASVKFTLIGISAKMIKIIKES